MTPLVDIAIAFIKAIDSDPHLTEEDKTRLKEIYFQSHRDAADRALAELRADELRLRDKLTRPRDSDP